MEMDGAIVRGLEHPAVLGAVPVVALHGAGGKIDERAVMFARTDIDGSGCRNVLREIPSRDARERGTIDLAVEMLGHRTIPLRTTGEPEAFDFAHRQGSKLSGKPALVVHERMRFKRRLLHREA